MTMTDTTTAAADALVEKLPTAESLRPVRRTSAEPLVAEVGSAVIATLVGSPTADLAVAFVDDHAFAGATDGAASVSGADILTPALTAAANQTGVGVVSDVRVEDASALFGDADTIVYDLVDKGGAVVGWFAVRTRAGNTTSVAEFEAAKLGRINNVEMTLTVEIGRTRMSVRDVLGLEPGAVVELDRSAGAPADILLNGRLIAYGEVVVVDQDYAVRVTQILDTQDGIG